jgi:hypothetical protein
MILPEVQFVARGRSLRVLHKVLYLEKVAPFRSTIFRLEIKREDIIDKSRECDKDRSRDFCIVSKQIN